MRPFRSFLLALSITTVLPFGVQAEQQSFAVIDLEALMSLDVQATSVMKRVESVRDTPASIYVLTQDQIRLSGASDLKDAVSLLPGINYRKINNSQRAVGIRQVPDYLSTGFLVMIDGRYIYNPIFPGTIWEHLEIPLTNIDRIELIRGAGGTLWNSKAANGVINIITKHSIDTQGTEIIAGLGSQGAQVTEFRYGGLFGQGGSYRVNFSTRETGLSGDYLEPAHDKQEVVSFNTRWDYTFSDNLSLMLKAGYLEADSDVTYNDVSLTSYQAEPLETLYKADKKSLMLRMDHRLSSTQTQLLQLAYSDGRAGVELLSGNMQLLNINYSMNTQFDRHKLGWGLEYQLNSAEALDNEYLQFRGSNRSRDENQALYIQNEYAIIPGSTYLMGSVRVDNDPLTGLEYQPSIRLMHSLNTKHRVWGGLSRSVMTPTVFSRTISALRHSPFGIPTYLTSAEDFDSEKFDNAELGYRAQLDSVEIDLSAFYQHSDSAVSSELAYTGSFPLYTRIDNVVTNNAEVTRSGAELVLNTQPNYNWSLQFSLSYLDQRSSVGTGYLSMIPSIVLKQASIRSDYMHTSALNSYLMIAYNSGIAGAQVPVVVQSIPEYVSLDAGVTWQVARDLEVGFYGKNLLGGNVQYPTSVMDLSYSTEIERSVMARAIWRF